MQLKLKIEVEPHWIIGVRPVNSTEEFDFKNKRDIVINFINRNKHEFKSNTKHSN